LSKRNRSMIRLLWVVGLINRLIIKHNRNWLRKWENSCSHTLSFSTFLFFDIFVKYELKVMLKFTGKNVDPTPRHHRPWQTLLIEVISCFTFESHSDCANSFFSFSPKFREPEYSVFLLRMIDPIVGSY
jgi:hypothetical protein